MINNLPNLLNYFKNDTFLKECYGTRIDMILKDAYTYIVENTRLPMFISSGMNSEENLWDEFVSRINDFMLNYADEDNLVMYNVMTSNDITYTQPIGFYDLWKKDLFNYICKIYKD